MNKEDQTKAIHSEILPSVPVVPPALPEENQPTTTTRSGQAIHPMARYQQSLAQREQGIVAWEVLVDQDEQEMIPTAQQQYELQLQMAEPIVYAAFSNLDILYLHEAMRAPDQAQFLQAMERDTIYIKTQVFRLLRYYSPAPRNIARSDWATQNITHNMTSSIT